MNKEIPPTNAEPELSDMAGKMLSWGFSYVIASAKLNVRFGKGRIEYS